MSFHRLTNYNSHVRCLEHFTETFKNNKLHFNNNVEFLPIEREFNFFVAKTYYNFNNNKDVDIYLDLMKKEQTVTINNKLEELSTKLNLENNSRKKLIILEKIKDIYFIIDYHEKHPKIFDERFWRF